MLVLQLHECQACGYLPSRRSSQPFGWYSVDLVDIQLSRQPDETFHNILMSVGC